jgi:hypothetical protein
MAVTALILKTKFLSGLTWRYVIHNFTNVGEEMSKLLVRVTLIAYIKHVLH